MTDAKRVPELISEAIRTMQNVYSEEWEEKEARKLIESALTQARAEGAEEERKRLSAAMQVSGNDEFRAYDVISQMVEHLDQDEPQSAREVGMDALVAHAKAKAAGSSGEHRDHEGKIIADLSSVRICGLTARQVELAKKFYEAQTGKPVPLDAK